MSDKKFRCPHCGGSTRIIELILGSFWSCGRCGKKFGTADIAYKEKYGKI